MNLCEEKIENVFVGYGKESVSDLYKAFDYYNEKLFDGELEDVEIEWNNRFTRVSGRVTYHKAINGEKQKARLLEISKKFHSINNKEEMLNTFLHELIHIKLARVQRGHGKLFQEECKRINKIMGLNIQTVGGEEKVNLYYKYKYQCKDCKSTFKRSRKLSPTMVCSKCFRKDKEKGKLELLEIR